MEISKHRLFIQERVKPQGSRTEKGFALVSLLALTPFLFALLSGLGVALFALKKKSLAQSLCVRAGLRMQTELGQSLTALLKANTKATRLRRRREIADRNLRTALASGLPQAITLAKAAQTAIILEQLQFRAWQNQRLAEASESRLRHARDLRSDVRSLGVKSLRSDHFYFRSLAVRPSPASSLTPNYVPTPGFADLQRHQFQFALNLAPDLPLPLPASRFQQITECSVTLKEESQQWKPLILAASARRRS
jgi:hypothetical protein